MLLHHHNNDPVFNIWPGFVDALSSLLIVITFVIMGFFISQVYLSDALDHSDSSLKNLQNQITEIQKALALKETEATHLKENHQISSAKIQELTQQLQQLQNTLRTIQVDKEKLTKDNSSLQSKILELTTNLNNLNTLLATERSQFATKEKTLNEQLKSAIDAKVAELKKVKDELSALEAQIPPAIRQNPELLKYRSEFFGSLQTILGNRSDIKIVGDRFVFQSEVLFERGSSELGQKGKETLDKLISVLKEITAKIPSNINWILRVDGHTDKIPIHNERFQSNWELSLARATSVIQYLISKGINPKNVMPAGFAEYYPLTTDPNQMAKNRRIEFRFDQR